MKKYTFTFIICLVVYFISEANLQYSMRPPFNYTGAEGSTCGQCHGNLNIGGGGITTLGLPDSNFMQGQGYDFGINISHPSLRGRWGFSITARDANNQPVGSFSTTNPNAGPNVTDLSHFMAVFKDSTSFTYDSLKWTAPVNPTPAQKTVKFYYIGNAANGDMGLTGDFIYSGTKTITLKVPNQPPTITISHPSNNSVIPAGSPVILTAVASDTDGTISKVDFFDNNVRFLTDSIAPYGYTSSEVPPGNYSITARAFDNTGSSTVSPTVKITVAACVPTGGITGEGFTNIPGSQVADLLNHASYPGNPSVTAQLNSFEYSAVGNNYGARVRGYICAPLTGDYTFYIAGDDQAGLWLSTNDNPSNRILIAYNLSPVGFRAWTAAPTQKSVPVKLIKGARYYIETLQKQSSGVNHLSVGWVLPDGSAEGPIPGNRLSPTTSLSSLVASVNTTDNDFGLVMKIATGIKKSTPEGPSDTIKELEITASPNPSHSYFTLRIRSNSDEKVMIILSDALGKTIERKSGVSSNGIVQIGDGLASKGLYIVEVRQGKRTARLKLLKIE